ncbi:MAG: GNAT family N-acetyltransferase [Promethearchaeota archaeon]
MQYRKSKPSDASAIAKVTFDTWNSTYKGLISERVLQKRSLNVLIQKWNERISNLANKQIIYVAENDSGNIIAFIWAGTEKINPVGNLLELNSFEGELMAIYVLKEYQNKKIGSNLVFLVVNYLLSKGDISMIVWVLKENPSKNFYKNLEQYTKEITI